MRMSSSKREYGSRRAGDMKSDEGPDEVDRGNFHPQQQFAPPNWRERYNNNESKNSNNDRTTPKKSDEELLLDMINQACSACDEEVEDKRQPPDENVSPRIDSRMLASSSHQQDEAYLTPPFGEHGQSLSSDPSRMRSAKSSSTGQSISKSESVNVITPSLSSRLKEREREEICEAYDRIKEPDTSEQHRYKKKREISSISSAQPDQPVVSSLPPTCSDDVDNTYDLHPNPILTAPVTSSASVPPSYPQSTNSTREVAEYPYYSYPPYYSSQQHPQQQSFPQLPPPPQFPQGGQPMDHHYYVQERQPPLSSQHHTPYDQHQQLSYPSPYTYSQQYPPSYYATTPLPPHSSGYPPTSFYGYPPHYAHQPPLPFIHHVSETDVLCGRGGATNNHVGNKSFRSLVKEYQLEYLQAKKKDKPSVADKIVENIKTKGGRFLMKDKATGYWMDIGDIRAREKTSQALREGAPVLRKLHSPKHSSSSKKDENDNKEEVEQRKQKEEENKSEECSQKDPGVKSSTSSLIEHPPSPPSLKRKAMPDIEIPKSLHRAGEEKEK